MSNEELTKIVAVIEGCKMVSPSPIGPLHRGGWNSAIELVLERIKAAADAYRVEST